MKSRNIKNLNLVFSDLCGGGCIYCPSLRATSNKGERIMKPEIFYRIMSEIIRLNLRENLNQISISENGDCFMNSWVIEYLRYIRKDFPNVKIICHNKLQHSEFWDIIAKENLLDDIYMNIDGTEKYDHIINNTKFFGHLEVVKKLFNSREEYGASYGIHILVLTLKRYIRACLRRVGKMPIKLRNIPKNVSDDYSVIKKNLKSYLSKSRGDTINRSFIFLWAEHLNLKNFSNDHKKYGCPNLYSIRETIYVDPNGNLYLCCYDSNYDLIYGNIMQDNLDNILENNNYQNFMSKLEDGKFAEIGFPCSHVVLCKRDKPTLKALILSRASRLINLFNKI